MIGRRPSLDTHPPAHQERLGGGVRHTSTPRCYAAVIGRAKNWLDLSRRLLRPQLNSKRLPICGDVHLVFSRQPPDSEVQYLIVSIEFPLQLGESLWSFAGKRVPDFSRCFPDARLDVLLVIRTHAFLESPFGSEICRSEDRKSNQDRDSDLGRYALAKPTVLNSKDRILASVARWCRSKAKRLCLAAAARSFII
jgi:hypothetical protein